MKVERAFKNIYNLLSQRFQAQREAGGPTSGLIAWANWECGMLEMPMKMKRGGRGLYLHKCFPGLGPGIQRRSSEDRFLVAAGASLMTDMLFNQVQAVREGLGHFMTLQLAVFYCCIQLPKYSFAMLFLLICKFPHPFYLLLKEIHNINRY